MKQKSKSTPMGTAGKKRLLAALLTLGLLIPESGMAKAADAQNQTTLQEQDTQIQTASQTDTYIVTLEENKQGETLLHELDDIATEEYHDYSELPEANIAVIQANERTIKKLKKKDGVQSVQEDIILNASKKSTSKKDNKEIDRNLLKKKQKKIAEWKDKTTSLLSAASSKPFTGVSPMISRLLT